MNPLQLMELMNDLPDDLITAESYAKAPKKRPVIRLQYLIPTVAACLIAAVAATVYPKLRTAPPEIRGESSSIQTDITDTAPVTTAPDETETQGSAASTDTESRTESAQTTAASFAASTTFAAVVTTESEVLSESAVQTVTTAMTTAVSTETTGASVTVSTPPETTQTVSVPVMTKELTEATMIPPMLHLVRKESCALPEPAAGSISTTPEEGGDQMTPQAAVSDYDGTYWYITFAEPCLDAEILSGYLSDGVLYLHAACLIDTDQHAEETVCLTLELPTGMIGEICVSREDYDDAAEYAALHPDNPMLLRPEQ